MKFFLAVVFFVTLISSFIIFVGSKQEGQWYDCRLSEFHPDYPTEVKEACRKLLREQMKSKSNGIMI